MSKLTKELLEELLISCNSIREILTCAGYSRVSGLNYSTFYRKLKKYGLFDLYEHLKQRRKNIKRPLKLSNEEFFVDSNHFRGTDVRNRILKQNLLEYKCFNADCPTQSLSDWLGQPIYLELDHINGRNRDNRLENLRFLCLQCHRQTPTFGNRNNVSYDVKKPKEAPKCLDCLVDISTKAVRCKVCTGNLIPKKFEISKEELEALIDQYSMTALGKMFGVSDNAVRKRARKLGIVLKEVKPRKKNKPKTDI